MAARTALSTPALPLHVALRRTWPQAGRATARSSSLAAVGLGLGEARLSRPTTPEALRHQACNSAPFPRLWRACPPLTSPHTLAGVSACAVGGSRGPAWCRAALGSAARLPGRAASRCQRRAPRLHPVAEAVSNPWRGRGEALCSGQPAAEGARACRQGLGQRHARGARVGAEERILLGGTVPNPLSSWRAVRAWTRRVHTTPPPCQLRQAHPRLPPGRLLPSSRASGHPPLALSDTQTPPVMLSGVRPTLRNRRGAAFVRLAPAPSSGE